MKIKGLLNLIFEYVKNYDKQNNTADVLVESRFHGYSLVADAKAFRLSRTAKNQKDFKVESLNVWKHDNNYAVLCCPYFQYPRKRSAIYKQALDYNVSLFSWEYFSFLINNNIKEDLTTNLSILWHFSNIQAKNTTCDKSDICFLDQQNEFLVKKLGFSINDLNEEFDDFKSDIISRGELEIQYWQDKILEIKKYSREKAIASLIESLKLNEKINTINSFIKDLESCKL